MTPKFRRIALAAACIAGLILPATAPAQAAEEKTTVPKVLDARSLSDRARPAVQLIESTFSATISAPEPDFDLDLLQNDLRNDPTFQVIAIAGDRKAAGEYGVQKFLENPLRYFKPGKARTKAVSITGTGSGFAVTPDGYIVTNAHVVKPEPDELKNQLIKLGLKDVLAADSKAIAADFDGITDAARQRLQEALVRYTVSNASISEPKTEVFTAVGKAVPGVVKTAKGSAAEIVSAGQSYPEKDVAILKIQATNLITLPVGDEAGHEQGDKLYAIGYPADATFGSGTTSGTELEPTLTDGLISAKKSTDKGVPVLQTSAATAPGSSGGPALDDTGQVIGLTTAGITATQGFNFVMPASVVKDFLQRANVKPTDGPATDLWEKGLDEASKKHYKLAQKTFRELDAIAPGSPYVQAKISESQQKISAGENVDPPSFPIVPVAIGAGVLLLLLLVGGGIGMSRRGKKKGVDTSLPAYGTPGPTGTVAAAPGTYGAPTPGYSEPPAYTPPPSGTPGQPGGGFNPPPSAPPMTPPPTAPMTPQPPPPSGGFPPPAPSGGFPAPPPSAPPPPPQSAPPPPPGSYPPPPPPGQ